MGVSWVFEHEKTAKEVERLLEGGGAEQIGTFTVDCLPYIPNDKLQSCIQHNYVLHHSNFPQSSFSIAPTDSLRTSPRTICDLGFDLILTKLSSGLTPDTAGKFELTGVEYRLRDFVVRVGTASQVTTTKGVIVEVEYEPSQVAVQSAHMMTEMMQMFFPQYAANKPDVINKSSPEPYSALDTMYQYLTIFRRMRKKT
ncbi:unnamed protein product [Cylicocyclus nassatus]|uniref:Mediator of RNA polymerase II transcription subunit 20 n=1 Tax=Cylicocyclus nassatus TaxID=53992 RepID=A0AA36H268_CYLNA|nr:unnamed protein product [Cylicocyclus nassatus]